MSVGQLNGRWQFLFKLSMTVGPLLVTAGVAAQGWILNRLSRIDERIAYVNERISVVEANRFSSKDGLDVWSAISQVRERLANIPAQIPPQWMIDKVNALESKVLSLELEDARQAGGKRR